MLNILNPRINHRSANCLLSSIRCFLYRRGYLPQEVEPGSYPFPKKQIPPAGRKSFKERLKEFYPSTDPSELVDIGLPFNATPLLPNRAHPKRKELETAARKRTLSIAIDTVHDVTEDSQAPLRRQTAAQHFGVFQDLYGPPHFFVPSVPLGLYFVAEDGRESATEPKPIETQPVYTGNLIAPSTAQRPPIIDLSLAPTDHHWTLVMTCPDEPMSMDDQAPPNEYVHWLVTNLSAESSGDEIVPYLPPLPYVGTGFHRYIFILYRQDNGKLDVEKLGLSLSGSDFRAQRSFNTLDFYRRMESDLTPAGLAFFQSSWDESVRNYFRNVLDVPEPIFEIKWPEPALPPQQRFPVANSWFRPRRHPHGLPLIRERYGVHSNVSFDVYLDRYRDRKELQEELVRERLKQEGNPLNPQEPRRKRPEFPAAVPIPEGMPTWWVRQEMDRRLRRGRWKQLEGHDD